MSTRVIVSGEDRLFRDLLIRALPETADLSVVSPLPDGWPASADLSLVVWSRSDDKGVADYLARTSHLPTLLVSARPLPAGSGGTEAGVQWCSLHASMSELAQAVIRTAERRQVPAASPRRSADSAPHAGAVGQSLTQREVDVLRLIVDGASTAHMASALRIRPSTARTYVSHVLRKLGVSSRLEAAARAVEQHLV